MSAAMEIVVTAQDKASDVIEGIGETADQAADWIEDNWVKVTAVAAGAAAGLEGFARSQRDNTEAARRLARAQGMAEDEVRDLAASMQDATFPMDEVLGLMELGTQRGLEGADALEEYATFWDTVGDATGENSQQLAQAGVALERIGIAAGNEAEALEAFGFVTESTTSDVGGFLSMVDRTGRELGDNTPHVNDMAAALGALEDQGIAGSRGQRELQQALRETDGDMDAALELLGISADEFARYQEEVAASGEVIQNNADDHAALHTPMERIQARAEELMFRFGGLAEGAAMLATPLAALGPAMAGAAKAKKGLALATSGLSKAMAFLAANPIVLVVAAVAALAAGIVIAYQRSERFRAIVDGAFRAVANVGRWLWESVLRPAWDGIQRGFDALGRGAERFGDIFRRVMRAAGRAVDLLTAPYRAGLNLIGRGIETVINGVAGAVNRVPSFDIPDWVPGLGGRSFSLPNVPTVSIPRLAQGGIVRARPGGTLAVIGEGGRDEAVVPLPGGGPSMADLVDEMRQIRKLLARGQTIVVDGDVLGRVSRDADGRFVKRNRRVTLG